MKDWAGFLQFLSLAFGGKLRIVCTMLIPVRLHGADELRSSFVRAA